MNRQTERSLWARYELDTQSIQDEGRKLGVATIAGGLLNWLFLNTHIANGIVAVVCGIVLVVAGSIKEVKP